MGERKGSRGRRVLGLVLIRQVERVQVKGLDFNGAGVGAKGGDC